MSWRCVFISQPAWLKLQHAALLVEQKGQQYHVPLEDVAAIVIDHPQVIITAQLLSACAMHQVSVVTVDQSHTPSGVLLAFTPHSRATKIMYQQMAWSEPFRKRVWQAIVRQKIMNQASLLALKGHVESAEKLKNLAAQVRSGDSSNRESVAAHSYFPALFGQSFSRQTDHTINHALNYGYSIVRSAIARSLVAYGYLPALGLHHNSELNAFNLADDLFEPYRPFVDQCVSQHSQFPKLDTAYKTKLVALLYQDIVRLEGNHMTGTSSMLALINSTVMSLGQSINGQQIQLCLPNLIDHEC